MIYSRNNSSKEITTLVLFFILIYKSSYSELFSVKLEILNYLCILVHININLLVFVQPISVKKKKNYYKTFRTFWISKKRSNLITEPQILVFIQCNIIISLPAIQDVYGNTNFFVRILFLKGVNAYGWVYSVSYIYRQITHCITKSKSELVSVLWPRGNNQINLKLRPAYFWSQSHFYFWKTLW